jgi:hypothetical protein
LKAVALATSSHCYLHPDADIHTVEMDDDGETPLERDGTPKMRKDELVDYDEIA